MMSQLTTTYPGGMPGSNGNDFPMKTMDQQEQQQQMPSYQGNGGPPTPGSLPPNSPLSSQQSGSMGLTSPAFVGADAGMGGPANIPPGPASQVGGTIAGGTNPAGGPAAAPKRPVRRGGKPQPERPIRALYCLGLKNPIRKLCIDITEWK